MDKYNNYSYFPSFPYNLLLLPNVASGTEQVLFLCFSWFTTHTKAHKHMLTTLLEHQTQPPFYAPPQSSRIHTSRATFIRLTIKSSNSTVLEKRWKTERLISIKRRKHDLTFPKPKRNDWLWGFFPRNSWKRSSFVYHLRGDPLKWSAQGRRKAEGRRDFSYRIEQSVLIGGP